MHQARGELVGVAQDARGAKRNLEGGGRIEIQGCGQVGVQQCAQARALLLLHHQGAEASVVGHGQGSAGAIHGLEALVLELEPGLGLVIARIVQQPHRDPVGPSGLAVGAHRIPDAVACGAAHLDLQGVGADAGALLAHVLSVAVRRDGIPWFQGR